MIPEDTAMIVVKMFVLDLSNVFKILRQSSLLRIEDADHLRDEVEVLRCDLRSCEGFCYPVKIIQRQEWSFFYITVASFKTTRLK